MADPSSDSSSNGSGDGWLARAREDTWASLGILLGLWIAFSLVLFLVVALATDSFTAALVAGPLLGLVAAGALGDRLGLVDRVDAARQRAPLWTRLLMPLPVLVLLFALFFVLLGSLVEPFVGLFLGSTGLALAGTGALIWLLGLWSDVPDRVRGSSQTSRLLALLGISVVVGLLGFLLGLMVLQEASFALALLLPSMIVGAVLAAWLSGWGPDAKAALLDLHFGIRIGIFAVLFIAVTFYFALLIGPFLPNATFAYAVAAAIALALLVPASMWVQTWRDLWAAFVDLGEERRVLAVTPVFPLGAALVFLLIVVLTSDFRVAYVASVPAGLVLFLLAGLPFGITQDLPRIVRSQNLPVRSGIFAGTFLLLTLYAYFAVALFLQDVEISLLSGMLFAALVVGLTIWRFELGEGLVEEFEAYGGIGEAAVLGVVFVAALVLSFVAIALSLGDFRLAFLVSVLFAAGVNYVVAHATGLVEGTREALAALPWWAELFAMSAVFVLAFAYGAVAIGTFVTNVPVALTLGAVFALAAVIGLSRDLELGEDVLVAADEKKRARSALLVLTFLGGFLVGLYVSAAALSVAGNDLFGFPFFIALLSGAGSSIALARRRDWDQAVLGRVRTTRDRFKVAVILALWLGIGIFTGFALQSLPVSGEDIGLESSAGLPLTLTLAAGLLVWAWLPVLLFKLIDVERTPVSATATMGEKPRTLASLGWGLLTFAVVLVLTLSFMTNTVLGTAIALAVAYLVALAFSALRRRESNEETS